MEQAPHDHFANPPHSLNGLDDLEPNQGANKNLSQGFGKNWTNGSSVGIPLEIDPLALHPAQSKSQTAAGSLVLPITKAGNKAEAEPDLPDRTVSQWRIIQEAQPNIKASQSPQTSPQTQTINTTATPDDIAQNHGSASLDMSLNDELVFGSGNLEEIFTDLFLDASVDYVLQHTNQHLDALPESIRLAPQRHDSEPSITQDLAPALASPPVANSALSQILSETTSHHRDASMVNYEQLANHLQQQLYNQQIQHQEQVQVLQASLQELLNQRDDLEAQLKRHIATHQALQQSLRISEKDRTFAQQQVQNLSQEVKTLQDQFQKQFGHTQDYEANVGHWKEQAVRHQHHALQLSAALDRLLSSQDAKLRHETTAELIPPQITGNPQSPSPTQEPVAQPTVAVTNSAATVTANPAKAQTESPLPLPLDNVPPRPTDNVTPLPHHLPSQGPRQVMPQNTHPNTQSTGVHSAHNTAPASDTPHPAAATPAAPPKRRVVELPAFLNRY